ncbi:MAG: MlaD family protein [Alphaproteobacteria bacterium]
MFKSISKENRELIVGSLTLAVSLAVILLFPKGTAKFKNIHSQNYVISAHFNKTDGILAGDKVRVAGLDIGKIVAINLNDNYGVDVKISLPSYIQMPEDSSASIHTNGLLGKKYISIEPGGMYEMIPDGGAITYTQDAMLVEDLLDKIIAIGRSLRGLPPKENNGEQ